MRIYSDETKTILTVYESGSKTSRPIKQVDIDTWNFALIAGKVRPSVWTRYGAYCIVYDADKDGNCLEFKLGRT